MTMPTEVWRSEMRWDKWVWRGFGMVMAAGAHHIVDTRVTDILSAL